MQGIVNQHFGETVFCIGTGPSLKGFDYEVLDDYTTFGVNRVLDNFDPDYFVACDQDMWDHLVESGKVEKSRAVKFAPEARRDIPREVIRFKRYEPRGDQPILSGWFENGLYWSGSSLFACINLAFLMGARKCVLLGVDMGDHVHCYDEPGVKVYPFPKQEQCARDLNLMYLLGKARNFHLVNANPKSTIRSIPIVDPYTLKEVE